jgi:site-specific DNA recombinase
MAVTFAIYARQSLDRKRNREGEGLAIERQIADCRELARRRGLPGEGVVYADNDVSAYSGKPRPEYDRLMRAFRRRDHDVVIVWHTDRLHRSPAELEGYIDVCEAANVVTHTVQAGIFDLSTPTGRMYARQGVTYARFEVEHKSQRQRAAIRQKAHAGKRHGGGRSFGYGRTIVETGNDGTEIRRATDIHAVNEPEAAAIRDAFQGVLRGESSTSIWKRWNRDGLLTQHGNDWSGTTFRRMMSRPSLTGMVTYKGEVLDGVEGVWPAIVDHQTWTAVQAILNDPARRSSPGPTPRHLAGGVTYCECGAPMKSGINSIKSKRDGSVRNFGVYKCSTGKPGHSSIVREKLDTAVRSGVIEVFLRGQAFQSPDSSETDERLVALNTALSEQHQREARLADAIADGTVSKAATSRTGAKIAVEIGRIQGEIDDITRQSVRATMLADRWATMLDRGNESVHRSVSYAVRVKVKRQLGDRFDGMTLEQKRALIRSTVKFTVRRAERGNASERVAAEPL